MKKEMNLSTENINKLLISFGLPCIISLLINSIYNIVDQIFIGQGVGFLGNAATNVIFPLVLMFNALAQIIGNGAAANLSLRMGEGNVKEAKKDIGSAITLALLSSIILAVILYIFLPKLVYVFGCTGNVYKYALSYGKVIIIGAPFVITYSALSSIIRADGSPKYSMMCLLTGAILNIILDPIFIFTFNMGVKGGALATVIGQIVSFIIAIIYIKKFKSFKLELKDFKINKSIFKTLAYGLSSFITSMTIMVLFIYMNNMMTKYGKGTKFGSDIPLSVYGIVSKLNQFYIAAVLGMAIGSQPIIGFNYGAKNYKRVREILRKVVIINLIIGVVFNILILLFPSELVGIFGSKDNELYTKFAVDTLRIFLGVSALNALEMSCSIIIQSLGNVIASTFVAFARQIILFIPISFVLSKIYGLYGILYGGIVADSLCFVLALFIFFREYNKIGKMDVKEIEQEEIEITNKNKLNKKVVITISREYGSGGRYVGNLLASSLGIKFYDKELIDLAVKESGLSKEYVLNSSETKDNTYNYMYNLNDKLQEAYVSVIKKISTDSCVIVGRCANDILKDDKNVLKVFIYNSENGKLKRATKYFKLTKAKAMEEINKINKQRRKYYKYYTGMDLNDVSSYDLCFNSDYMQPDEIAKELESIIKKDK